jgi:carbon-monoxide dehydrogenase large subunit
MRRRTKKVREQEGKVSILGNRVLRSEDPQFLTTGARYLEDLDIPGAAWVVYVRSTEPHARIDGIDVSEARQASGVLDVVTASDVDLPPLPPEPAVFPEAMSRPWLANGIVRFVGEPVAAIVAETRAQAADAADLVVVDYDPLAAAADPEAALAGDVLLWPEVGTNVAMEMSEPQDESLFEGCEVVVRQRVVNQRLAPCPLEVRAAAAKWEGDRLVQWISTQAPHGVRDALAKTLDLDAGQVRVVAPDVGGGFGAKGSPYPEELFLAWLARRLGRPVRWTESRTENLLAMGHGRAQIQDLEIGGTRDGQVLAYRVNVIQDAGAYPGVGGILPSLTRMMLTGVYNIPKVGFSNRTVVTTTTPTTAYRGAGRPEATAAVERAMDLFAAEIGMDPAEVRRRNLVSSDAFPFTTPTGTTYDSGDYARALDLVLEAAGYSSLREEQGRRRAAADRRQLGIGLSVYVEITNGLPGSEFGAVEVRPDGTALVRTGTSPHGQGHATAWSMLVADTLGIPVDSIQVVHGDTDVVPRGIGTFGSRSLQTGGVAVRQAAVEVVERGRRLAAELLEADPADVVLDQAGGRFHVAGAPEARGAARTWAELARETQERAGSGRVVAGGSGQEGPEGDGAISKSATGGGQSKVALPSGRLEAEVDFEPPGPTFPFGAHVAVVEVDTETGRVQLQRLVAVDDAGRIVAPLLAEGQVHGGLAQGAAQALLEEVRYDEQGNPLTANLADYPFITAAELPSFETVHAETPTPRNELGAKGIGESGTIGSTPAVQNAVVDALAHLGVRHVDMPTSPERVWRAVASARAGGPG